MDFYKGPEKESITRNKKNRTIAWIFFILSFLLIVLGGAIVFFDYKINTPLGDGGQPKIITIEKGEKTVQIAKKLQDQGIIENDFYFLAYVFIKRAYSYLQAGSYSLSPRQTIPDIVDILSEGEVIPIERQVTIPEGWDNKKIDLYLFERHVIQNKNEFVSVAKKGPENSKYGFLSDLKTGDTLQGFLFPDTYRVFKNVTPSEVAGKMLDNFDSKFSTDLIRAIQERNRTVLDVMIMAGIVELEVANQEDREIVAGILWKRLDNNIALQADVTVRYATENWDEPLTKSELLFDSPFNTRLYRGLPPSPIANPGLEAIKATIYPQNTDYLYYLSAPNGKTIYSKTYAEHLAAKRKYLSD